VQRRSFRSSSWPQQRLLRAALSFLRAHPGQVSPVTLTPWGNDWLQLLLDGCKNDVTCVRRRGPGAVASFGSRLTSILQQLRAVAPTAEIIVTGAWNVDPKELDELGPIYRSLDAAIARAASASRSRVAEALPVFNAAGNARARLCVSPSSARRAIRTRPTPATARGQTHSWRRRATRGSREGAGRGLTRAAIPS
jgi:hypothetical protein